MLKKLPKQITINFDNRILESILFEVAKYPNAEEGGKYIGYVAHDKLGTTVTISDFLPGGPNAKRTSVEFFPDGDYQERLFRQIEKVDPEIEHLGSWHTHHCNQLRTLSTGDIDGYFRTVNKKNYRPDVFIASLVKFVPQNPEPGPWIDHFLFLRGDDQFYEITCDINFMKSTPTSLEITGHNHIHREFHKVSVDERSAAWFESETGRRTLAEHREFFNSHFVEGFKAIRKMGQIQLRCQDRGRTVSVLYPLDTTNADLLVTVSKGTEAIIKIECNLSHRAKAYAAAIAALGAM